MANDNDMVSCTCYGRTRRMTRKTAEKFFLEGIMHSEGNEQKRYMRIYSQLLHGEINCTDKL